MPEIALNNLPVGGEYTVEVRAYRIGSSVAVRSPWSVPLTFTVEGDTVPPGPVTNAQVVLDGRSILVTWDPPTQNGDGSTFDPETDLDDYKVVMYEDGDFANGYAVRVKTEDTIFSIADVIAKNPAIVSGVTKVQITALDYTENESTPVIIDVVTPVLDDIILTADSGRVVTLNWNNDPDANYYEVHRSDTTGFTPGPGTLVSQYPASDTENVTNSVIDDAPDGQYFYVIVGYGFYGGQKQSNEVSAQIQSVNATDDVPPSTPAAPTVTGGAHSFTVEHNRLQSDGTTPLESYARFLHVYASDTSGFTADENTFIGSVVIADEPTVSDTFTYVIAADSDIVYVRVAAGTRDGADGPASAEASATVSSAGSTYIQDLAVTNAKINDLDANKLNANTAFVNNLNVEAILTVQSGGIVQSSDYVADTSGWRISDDGAGAGYAEFNDIIARGTIEATSGLLQNLNVYGTITVGDGTTAGTIRSNNYVANTGAGTGAGWAITDQEAEFNNVVVSGTVYATSGSLQNLNVAGSISVGPNASSVIQHSGGSWSIDGSGFAEFSNASVTGSIYATSGTLSNLSVVGTLTISGASGRFRSGTTGQRVEISLNDEFQLYNSSNNYWNVTTTPQGNFYIESGTIPSNDGTAAGGSGLAIGSAGKAKIQMLSGATSYSSDGGFFLTGTGGANQDGMVYTGTNGFGLYFSASERTLYLGNGLTGIGGSSSVTSTVINGNTLRVGNLIVDGTFTGPSSTHTHTEYANSGHDHSGGGADGASTLQAGRYQFSGGGTGRYLDYSSNLSGNIQVISGFTTVANFTPTGILAPQNLTVQGTFTNNSDSRIKSNVSAGQYGEGLDVLCSVPIRSFQQAKTYTVDETTGDVTGQSDYMEKIGYIAQELEAAVTPAQAALLVSEGYEGIKQVDITNMLFMAIDAIQTLCDRVEALEGAT